MKKGIMFSFTVLVLLSSIAIMAIANPAYAQTPSSDLAISLTSSPDTPVTGSITYTFDVTNSGPDPADNIVVTDTLPPGVTFDVNSDGSCNVLSGIVTCNEGHLDASGPNSDSGPILIVVVLNTGSGLPNTVTVSSDSTDPNTSNNSATVGTAPPPSGPQTLQDLITLVQSFHLKKEFTHDLIEPLNDAIKDLTHHHHEKDSKKDKENKHHEKETICNELNEFIKIVNSKEGHKKLTTDQASQLIEGANTVKSNNNCS